MPCLVSKAFLSVLLCFRGVSDCLALLRKRHSIAFLTDLQMCNRCIKMNKGHNCQFEDSSSLAKYWVESKNGYYIKRRTQQVCINIKDFESWQNAVANVKNDATVWWTRNKKRLLQCPFFQWKRRIRCQMVGQSVPQSTINQRSSSACDACREGGWDCDMLLPYCSNCLRFRSTNECTWPQDSYPATYSRQEHIECIENWFARVGVDALSEDCSVGREGSSSNTMPATAVASPAQEEQQQTRSASQQETVTINDKDAIISFIDQFPAIKENRDFSNVQQLLLAQVREFSDKQQRAINQNQDRANRKVGDLVTVRFTSDGKLTDYEGRFLGYVPRPLQGKKATGSGSAATQSCNLVICLYFPADNALRTIPDGHSAIKKWDRAQAQELASNEEKSGNTLAQYTPCFS